MIKGKREIIECNNCGFVTDVAVTIGTQRLSESVAVLRASIIKCWPLVPVTS